LNGETGKRAVRRYVTQATEQGGHRARVPSQKGDEMKQIIVIALLVFSTAAKADWTPGSVRLDRFQQELYSDQKAVSFTALKSQLSALFGWSRQATK
jgi:hypothetical protein